MKKTYFIAMLLLLMGIRGFSQVQYPATVNLTVKPSPFLSDYVEAGSNGFVATITFNDMNEVSRDVYFRITIESAKVKLVTAPSYRPTPVTLYTNEPLTLRDVQWEDYFNLQNLECAGMDKAKLQQYGQIPEGLYKYSVEVIEYATGKIISRKTPVIAKVELKEPPLITSPAKGGLLKSSEPQFTIGWRQADPEVNASNTSYILKLYEIDNSEKNPLLAINNHTAREIYISDPVKNLLYTYDLSHPALEAGKRYAFKVQAVDDAGRPRFKNNGESEVFWFHYGYPVGGNIRLQNPPQNAAFTRFDVPTLAWNACDNIVNNEQPVVYKVKVVVMEPGDDTAWAMQNVELFSYTTPPITNKYGSNATIPSRLGHLQRFAWQVTAESDGVEIGRSMVGTFTGPPLIESFFVENHEVVISKINNVDMDHFSGEGTVKVNKDGTVTKVKYENLKISENIGVFVCDSGGIWCKAENFKDIDLIPHSDYEVNGHAAFVTDSIRITPKDGMALKGRVIWQYSLANKNKEKHIESARGWINYNDYTLAGQVPLAKDERFDLLEPANFKMNLSQSSLFTMFANIWSPQFTGSVEVNENLKGRTTQVYRFPFYGIKQLFYNEVTYLNPIDEIVFTAKANVFLLPTKVAIDFSESRSPEKFAMKQSWKGISFENFNIRLANNIDQSNQLKPASENVLSYSIMQTDSVKACVVGSGLDFYVNHIFDQTAAHFCTFPTDIKQLKLSVLSGYIREGWIRGAMYIPLISESEKYTWHLPLTATGFGTGYLDETNERLSFTFAKNDAESKLNVKVKRAQFADNNRLSLDIEVEYPYLNVTFTDIADFCIWGNKAIGIKKEEGIMSLTYRKQAVYKDYSINLRSIGAGRICEQYVFGFDADINMGEDVSGGNGAPVMNLYASATNSHLTEPCNKGVQDIKTPEIYVNKGDFQMTDEGVGEDNSTFSVEEEIERQNQEIRDQMALSEALANTFDSLNINIQVRNLEVGNLITNTTALSNENKVPIEFLPSDAIELTPERMINILEFVALFVDEKYNPQIKRYIEKIKNFEHSDYYTIFQEFGNGTALKYAVDMGVDKIVKTMTQPLSSTCDTVKKFVNEEVLKAENKAFVYFDSVVNMGFAPIQQGITATLSATPDLADMSVKVIKGSKEAIMKEIKNAVYASVQKNLLTPFNLFIDTSINNRMGGVVDSTLRQNANRIIRGEMKSISMNGIKSDCQQALKQIGEDMKTYFSFDNMLNSIKNTGNDIIKEIKWSDIQEAILADLFNPKNGAVPQTVADVAAKILGDYGDAAISAALQNIPMAFDLLKGNRSKTDPIRIVFCTPVADGEGYIDLDTGDVVYGKVWRGSINATVKKPCAFSAYAMYVNGTTTQLGAESFKYWFLEFGVSNIKVPLTPVPLDLTAASGRVFQRMNQTSKGAPYVPDKSVNFGAGVKAVFIDQSGGGLLSLAVDLNLKVKDKGFEMAMFGDVLAANQIVKADVTIGDGKEMGTSISRSLIIGEGSMLFSSIDKTFTANAKVTTNTSPLLCAGGEFNAFITPTDWAFSLGTRENPIQAKLLCMDFAKMGGWFSLSRQYLDLGLFQHVDISGKTPWIGPKACRVQGYGIFQYDLGLSTLVFWKPLKIKEAAVWVDILMEIGINYDTPLKNGSLVIAGVNLGGNLIYRSEPDAVLSGEMYGKIKVLGVGINLKMHAEKTFAKR